MLKEKLFKLLFPAKYSYIKNQEYELENLKELESKHKEQLSRAHELVKEIGHELGEYRKSTKEFGVTESEFMEYCLKTLGVPVLDFSNVDDDGKPPHYLANLTDAERKDWIAHLETIYADPKFQSVVSYVINLIGNYSLQKAEDEKMRNGKLGIIGIRTLMTEFINAHTEFSEQKKPREGFDPLAVMSE